MKCLHNQTIVPPGRWKLTLFIFILCGFSLEYYAVAVGEGEESNLPFLNLAEGVSCGETEFQTKARILGGVGADEKEFPYLASIQKAEKHFCAGFIVKHDKLISSAHCFLGSNSYKDYQILLGSNDWSDRSNASNLYRISKVLIHPNFSYLKPNVENDIALLTLDRSVHWTPKIQPICLATDEKERYEEGVIAGWGMRSEKENVNEWMKDTTLHKVSLPIWSNSDCQTVYRRHRVNWNTRETHVCAGYKDRNQDTSSGDSGSPLVVIGEHGNRIAYGIVSVGEGSLLPGIYTRLSAFSKWITSNQ